MEGLCPCSHEPTDVTCNIMVFRSNPFIRARFFGDVATMEQVKLCMKLAWRQHLYSCNLIARLTPCA